MPTYEYRCPEGHDFEKFVLKISDAKSELPCPTCGLAAPRRVSAGSGFLFKGSGFYITDYGKDGKKDAREATAKAAAAATKTGDAAKADTAVKSDAATKGGAAAAPAKPAPTAPTPKSGPEK